MSTPCKSSKILRWQRCKCMKLYETKVSQSMKYRFETTFQLHTLKMLTKCIFKTLIKNLYIGPYIYNQVIYKADLIYINLQTKC